MSLKPTPIEPVPELMKFITESSITDFPCASATLPHWAFSDALDCNAFPTVFPWGIHLYGFHKANGHSAMHEKRLDSSRLLFYFVAALLDAGASSWHFRKS